MELAGWGMQFESIDIFRERERERGGILSLLPTQERPDLSPGLTGFAVSLSSYSSSSGERKAAWEEEEEGERGERLGCERAGRERGERERLQSLMINRRGFSFSLTLSKEDLYQGIFYGILG